MESLNIKQYDMESLNVKLCDMGEKYPVKLLNVRKFKSSKILSRGQQRLNHEQYLQVKMWVCLFCSAYTRYR